MLYNQKDVNLHIHSFYCGHGSGNPVDFVEEAKRKGVYKVLGFSEHCPVPNDKLPSRMPMKLFPDYIRDVRELKACEPDLKILLGAECDWDKDLRSFYSDYVLEENNLEFLSGSIHHMHDELSGGLSYICHFKDFGVKDLKKYVKLYTEMLSSGLFLFGCHPDLFFGGYRKWDSEAIAASKDIIDCAKDCNIPLEINDLGLRKNKIETSLGLRQSYSIPEFWTMAKDSGIKICTNTDAHFPKDISGVETDGFMNQSFKFASETGVDFINWEITSFSGAKKALISAVR